jgi:lysine 6-dehydrogenase
MGLGAAYDLAHNSPGVTAITIADADAEKVRQVVRQVDSPILGGVTLDVGDEAATIQILRGHDAAISCVNYWHNERLARACIKAGVNFCDLGGNNDVVRAELALNAEAKAAGVNIIPDCGLAPGMVSVLAAHGAQRFTALESIRIRVGGLPQKPEPPLNYQIVFSPEGLINEYIERARVIRNGEIVEVDSMTELEWLEFPPPYGKLEAFQTSGGTSTLPDTFLGHVRELDYKTLRYPGHCEQFKLLIDLGLTSSEPVMAEGATVSPRRVLSEILLRNLPADGPDLVFVNLAFRGTMDGLQRSLRYTIIDRQDEATGLSAMMRTTAFPASIIAQMMARGETTQRGAVPQELAIPPDAFVAELARRDINIRENVGIE